MSPSRWLHPCMGRRWTRGWHPAGHLRATVSCVVPANTAFQKNAITSALRQRVPSFYESVLVGVPAWLSLLNV